MLEEMKMENLNKVIVANRGLLARSRELNTRAGETIFPIPSRDELNKLFVVALGGARRAAEIRNLPALLFPALDQRAIDKVLAESPDTITILGQEVAVEYRSGYNPRVQLDFRGDEGHNWLQLPDDGIHLPGGREVSIYTSVEGHGYYIEAESSKFKAKAREKIARDALKKRVSELYSAHSYNRELPEEMRSRMYNTYYGYLGGATTVSEIEAFITEVEVAVTTIEKRKVEAERKQREAEARREAVDEALRGIGYPEAHIWVPENGEVAYVLAGKTSKMGNFVVQPTADIDDTSYNGRPYCFGDYNYRAWVAFGFGVKSRAQDFSGMGSIQSEVKLFVPKGLLSAGVYGVSGDEQGQFFFPVTHHNAEGVEVIPELGTIRKVRVSKESNPSAPASNERPTTDALEALRQKWGAR
jgi:hypothetical protein